MDLIPASSFLVAGLSAASPSMNIAPVRSSHGLTLMFTDSVALPARCPNSGSCSFAFCAQPIVGSRRQASANLLCNFSIGRAPNDGLGVWALARNTFGAPPQGASRESVLAAVALAPPLLLDPGAW